MLRAIVLLLIAMMGAGCKYGGENVAGAPSAPPSQDVGDITVGLRTLDKFGQPSQAFVQGEVIDFELSITNGTTHLSQMEFSSGCQYDLLLKAANGDVVWDLLKTVLCVASVTKIVLEPGETRVDHFPWDQTIDRVGTRAAPGKYSIEGFYLEEGIVATANLSIL